MGRPAAVQASSVPSEKASVLLRTWEREYIGWSPDVVILAYGHYETIHLFLPRWLERHANSLKARPRRWRNFYRKKILRPCWVVLARLQAKIDQKVPARVALPRIKRVTADLERLIIQLQQLSSPLIFLMELQPPATRTRSWFPGMTGRIALTNRELAAMVARLNRPDLRWFNTTNLVATYAESNLDVATPDGFHYTPHMHQMIGRELARQIAEWADAQPHLRLGGDGS